MVEVPPTALSEFQGESYTIHEQAGPHVWFLILNLREGPFTEQLVRQAANYAIDKEAIVNDVLEGTAEVAAGRRRPRSPGPTTRSSTPIRTIPSGRANCSPKRAWRTPK